MIHRSVRFLVAGFVGALGLVSCGYSPGAPRSPVGAAGGAEALPQLAGLQQDALPQIAHLFKENGPPLNAYRFIYDGFTDPTGGQVQHAAAAFNSLAGVLGVPVPPRSALTGRASTYGGSPGVETNIQDPTLKFAGTVPLKCGGNFSHGLPSGICKAASGSHHGAVHEFGFVQSWPFYVDSGSSSNVNPGSYTLESTTDDGAFFMLAPKPFTYAQPANFNGATGLTAGMAITQNENLFGPSQATGTFAIAQAVCGKNLYWLTWEYFEAIGGGAGMEYSWQPPGAASFQQATQAVIWGQAVRDGRVVAGDAVSVSLPGGGTAALVTDANGCFGYNFAPFAAAQSISVSVTDGSVKTTLSATLGNGQAKKLKFSFT